MIGELAVVVAAITISETIRMIVSTIMVMVVAVGVE